MRKHHTLPSETPVTPAHRRLRTAFPAALLLAGIPLFAQQPAPANQQTTAPAAQPAKAPAGCPSAPVKKPKFHIPAKLQKAITGNVVRLNNTTGVQVDPNAPAKAVDDAQKDKPCTPNPPASAPPSTSTNAAPTKQ